MRSKRSSSLFALLGALVPCLALAQADVARPARETVRPPFAIVRVAGTVARAPDSRRAAFIPTLSRDQLSWSMRVDSATSGAWYVTEPLYQPAGANAVATVRIPAEQGVLGLPSLSTRPRPTSIMSRVGRTGAELPSAEAERVATHAFIRRLLETGALFESDPPRSTGVRHTRYADGAGDIALTIDAVRSSRTLRDTSVLGRRVHMVRDSTAISIEHATLVPSRFHSNVERTRESLRGTIVGIRLVEAETHRAFQMDDTVAMQGTLVSDDGLGGRFRSPLLITSTRRATLHDAFWQSTVAREPFDMVRYDAARPQPLTSARRDSLFLRLDAARALGTRDSVRAMLLALGAPDASRDTTIWPRVRARSLAIGDTASTIAGLRDGALNSGRSISAEDYHMLRPSLADAVTAFRLGVDREVLALDLMHFLMRAPPVLAAPGAPPMCAPNACAAMRADARSSQPGLQAVGLVAAMVSEPRIWTDSVLRYAATNPYLATRARWFAEGVASTAVASAKAPIPEPDAPYDAWRHWLTGRDSSYERSLRTDTMMLRLSRQMNRPRPIQASSEAAAAIRFAQVRTGRDYLASLRAYRDTTGADSARALFNALLIALGDRTYTDAEISRILLSPTGAERDAAKAQLTRTLSGAMRPAGDSLAAVVGRHLVNMVFADSTLSRSDNAAGGENRYWVQKAVDSLPRYVLMHAFPDAPRARAAALGYAPVERGWQLRPGDNGYLIEFGAVQQRGAFVQVAVTYSTLYSRGATRSGGYAGGFQLTLVEGPNGWTVIDAMSWVT